MVSKNKTGTWKNLSEAGAEEKKCTLGVVL